jgi:type IV secretory pathway TrbD component
VTAVGEVDPEASARKLRAKRANERLKLAAGALNTLALATVGAAFIIPGVTSLENVRWAWIPVGVILHLLAHLVLGLMKSED